MKSSINATIVLLVLTSLSGTVQAALLTWDGGTGFEPDEISPPYTLFDSSVNDPVLSSGILTIDTDSNAELMGYRMLGASLVMPTAPRIEFNMRMGLQSSSSPTLRTGAAVSITTQNSVGNVVYIGTDEVFFLDTGGVRGPSAMIDTDSAFHDYRIEVAGINSGAAISLFQDNSLVLSHVLITDAANYGNTPRIFFGNNTTAAHGVSEWTSFEHNAAASVVPEPSSLFLMSIGLVFIAFSRKKQLRRSNHEQTEL